MLPSNHPLTGIRVLDFTHQVAGPFCTMLLADLGAEVVKVERFPGGDQARNWPVFGPSVFLALNRNKKSIAINLSNPSSLSVLTPLIKSSHILVENFTPGTLNKFGISFDSVCKINPKIVYCSIWGYRPDGPFSGYPAWDPVIQARSGLMMATGEADGPPIRTGTSIVDQTSGIFATVAILAALRRAEEQGKPERIIVPLFDCALSLMSFWIARYSIIGKDPPRMGSSWAAFAPYKAYATRTGYVFLAASNNEFWRSLCEALSRPDLASDQRFQEPESRVKNRDLLDMMLSKEIEKWKPEDLIRELESRNIPCSPVNNVSELFEKPYSEDLVEMPYRTDEIQNIFTTTKCPIIFESNEKLSYGAPPALGENTLELLREAGFSDSQITKLAVEGVVGLPS